MKVKVYGEEFECNRAVKGSDYVKLYSQDGICIASFDGISSFDGYEIIDGEMEST